MQLEAAEAEGYTRARGEFEADNVFLRGMLKKMRDGAFSGHILGHIMFLDTFLLGNATRGKTYAMNSWRLYFYDCLRDRAGRNAEEALKKEVVYLRQRDGAFSKFVHTFLLVNATRGKTYAMSSWRLYVFHCVRDRAGRVITDLKKANADLEAQIAAHKDIIKEKD